MSLEDITIKVKQMISSLPEVGLDEFEKRQHDTEVRAKQDFRDVKNVVIVISNTLHHKENHTYYVCNVVAPETIPCQYTKISSLFLSPDLKHVKSWSNGSPVLFSLNELYDNVPEWIRHCYWYKYDKETNSLVTSGRKPPYFSEGI